VTEHWSVLTVNFKFFDKCSKAEIFVFKESFPNSMTPMKRIAVAAEGTSELAIEAIDDENFEKALNLKKSIEIDLITTRENRHVLKIEYSAFL